MREYLLVTLVAAATTYLLGGLSAKLARRIGAVPPVRERDVHTVPVPRLGGLAMVAGIGAAFLLASRLPFLRQAFVVSNDVRAVYTGVLVLAVVGVVDDTIGLDALTKFAGQVLAAGIVVVQGLEIYWLPLPGTILALPSSQSAIITVLLLVVAVNAVNFVDGLDGLAAGVVAIGGGAFFVYCYELAVHLNRPRATTAALIAAAVCGACLGFLPHNLHPARVIMGDTGAMVLGLVLASSSISLTSQLDPAGVDTGDRAGGALATLLPTLLPLLLPVAVVALPFTDLVLAVVRRVSAGRSPFSPDKKHLHHRLLQLGHSHRRAVGLLWFWAAVLSFGVLVIGMTARAWVIWTAVAVVAVGIVFTLAIPERLRARRRRAVRLGGAPGEPPPDPMTAPLPPDLGAPGPAPQPQSVPHVPRAAAAVPTPRRHP